MKKMVRLFLLVVLSGNLGYSVYAQTGWVEGIVKDKEFNEALPGATIQIKGANSGTVTDFDGNYKIEKLNPGVYTLIFSYISYAPQEIKVEVKRNESSKVNVELGQADLKIAEVTVTGKKNLESENALLLERKMATIGVESLGAREMSLKGISNAEDGVKKITGISIAGANQVFVRGLGDRYSATALNGLSIASPNPDNKLIPLSLFPSAMVKNISVNKVFQPCNFADYAGAYINIESKENVGKDYLMLSVSTGGVLNTMFRDFYSSDKVGSSYLGYMPSMKLSKTLKNSTRGDVASLRHDPFNTNFNIGRNVAPVDLKIEVLGGESVTFRNNDVLNFTLGANYSNGYNRYMNAYTSTLNAQGVILDKFDYDKYAFETSSSALAQFAYNRSNRHFLNYNFIYVHNSEDSYSDREGYDQEGNPLVGSNSVTRFYNLINNQLHGRHDLNTKLELSWSASYGYTTSDEPDRRQIMYVRDGSELHPFVLNQQETNRFFGNLKEDEIVADARLKWKISETSGKLNFLETGAAYKRKKRDYNSMSFYYAYNKEYAGAIIVDNIYTPSEFLNNQTFADGNVSLVKNAQDRNNYYANADLGAAFAELNYNLNAKFLLSGGLRYEYSEQTVRYWTDAGAEKLAKLPAHDVFPAINLKYDINKDHNIRINLSRTVTRPSFIEMSPFEYRESYGGATVRGYADIKNGYNNNFDFRYEYYPTPGELISVSAYYKFLQDPIERVQQYSSGAIQTFRNVNEGHVAGIEIELKKNIYKDLKLGVNGSYIFTRMILPDDGVYTDKKRALQGASPYLVNADISYNPKFSKERSLNAALVYNLRGPRIYMVGILGVGNVMEEAFHTLDFVASYNANAKLQFKLQAKNLINQVQRYTQEVADTGESKEVQAYKMGTSLQIGVSYNF
ncbi:MAG: TonB-dependent receptor [Bacteroidales bacterium]|nr:TonB-dependent receptor [Bacteroidales bacterium]